MKFKVKYYQKTAGACQRNCLKMKYLKSKAAGQKSKFCTKKCRLTFCLLRQFVTLGENVQRSKGVYQEIKVKQANKNAAKCSHYLKKRKHYIINHEMFAFFFTKSD